MRIESIGPDAPVEIECDGFVPLTIRLSGYAGPSAWAPKYWRTGDFDRSLVEVAVNPMSGEICKIVVPLLRQSEEAIVIADDLESRRGCPRALPSLWDDDCTRVDVEQHVSMSLTSGDMTLVFGDIAKAHLKKVECGRVVFLVDRADNLRGFRVEELSEQEVENIKYAIDSAGA